MTPPSAPPRADAAPVEQAGTTVALEAHSPGRRAVLECVKREGEATAEEIATSVGITVGAARQHLVTLEAAGLVAHRDVRGARGRPRRHHVLTPGAEALWPKRYGQLTNQLLGFIEQADPELVRLAFDGRGADRARRARARLEGKSFDAQVRELAAILDEDGYLAECARQPDGSWLLVEHNCAILDVATRYSAACTSEIAFLRAALDGAEVERVRHMMNGDHVCAYTVRPRRA